MAAGLATLGQLSAEAYQRLEILGARWEAGLNDSIARHGVAASVAREGSIAWLCLQGGETPRVFSDIDEGIGERYRTLHSHALSHGVYLPPSAYEVVFLSLAHSDEDVEQALAVMDEGLRLLTA